jgi:integrase
VKAVIREVKIRASYQAHGLLGTLRRMFNWAVENGESGLEHSPCDHLKAKSLIGAKRARVRILTDAEVRALWRWCERTAYPRGDLGKFLLLTGARHREAARAPWSEFDLTKAIWTISPERFKSDAPHVVPLTADALALLQSLPRYRGGTWVFSHDLGRSSAELDARTKAKIDARMLRTLKAMARMRGDDPESVTLAPWVVHDLRRTVRTHLAALRIPDHVAEMVLGHAKKGLQRVYDLHGYQAEIAEALERWATRLRSIVSPPPANVVPIERARVS